MSKRRSNNKNISTKIAIVSAMMAFSLAMLALFVENTSMATLVQTGFLGSAVVAIEIVLLLEIIFNLIFLISTGTIEGYDYEEKYRSKIKWLQKLVRRLNEKIKQIQRWSYGISIRWFVLTFVSFVYAITFKVVGIDETESMQIAFIATVSIVIVVMMFVGITKTHIRH